MSGDRVERTYRASRRMYHSTRYILTAAAFFREMKLLRGYIPGSNQDLIWCVIIGVYMGFWVHRGSSLLTSYAPPQYLELGLALVCSVESRRQSHTSTIDIPRILLNVNTSSILPPRKLDYGRKQC